MTVLKKIGKWTLYGILTILGILWLKESLSSYEPPPNASVECSYNAFDCSDFSSAAQAEDVFNICGGVNNDIHHLDGDGDGIPCESLR